MPESAMTDEFRSKIKALVYELFGSGCTREEVEEEVSYYLDGAQEDAE